MEVALRQVAAGWQQGRRGLCLEMEDGRGDWSVSAMLWADNLVFLTDKVSHLVEMAREATTEIRKWGLEWKPSSLELLYGVAVERKSTVVPLELKGPGPPLSFS
eukprot:6132158-Lingulodinium_polyedra.AAC.1